MSIRDYQIEMALIWQAANWVFRHALTSLFHKNSPSNYGIIRKTKNLMP